MFGWDHINLNVDPPCILAKKKPQTVAEITFSGCIFQIDAGGTQFDPLLKKAWYVGSYDIPFMLFGSHTNIPFTPLPCAHHVHLARIIEQLPYHPRLAFGERFWTCSGSSFSLPNIMATSSGTGRSRLPVCSCFLFFLVYRYERTPSGRMGHVTELNGAALYLASCVENSPSLRLTKDHQLIGSNRFCFCFFPPLLDLHIAMRALFALELTFLSTGVFFRFGECRVHVADQSYRFFCLPRGVAHSPVIHYMSSSPAPSLRPQWIHYLVMELVVIPHEESCHYSIRLLV